MEKYFILSTIIISAVAFVFVFWLYLWVSNQPSSNQKVAIIGETIRKEDNIFLKKEYIVLAKFTGIVAILMFVFLLEPI